jgi:phosphate butyryltransferase
MKVNNFDELIKTIYDFPKRKVAVAVGQDYAAIEAIMRAEDANTADGVFVGDQKKIERKAKEINIDLTKAEIVHVEDDVEACHAAVKLVSSGECDVLMKGKIHTDDFLRGILNKEYGLRTKHIMSHAFILYPEKLKKFLVVTDAAMNIQPNFEQKADIAANAIGLVKSFGVEVPKVAVLAAVELVNPQMQATQDAAILSLMNSRGQFKEGMVEGPFAFDNAVSELAAKIKGIDNPVAGRADILLVPNIESGNILVKTFAYLADGKMGGVLLGGKHPIVLTSRADSAETKYLSICSAVYLENFQKAQYKLGNIR